MENCINISFEGNDYTLCYTLDSIQAMEQNGFDLEDATRKPMSSAEILLTGAMRENHVTAIRAGVPHKIIKSGIPKKLVTALIKMYTLALDKYFKDDDEAEDSEKNVKWEMNF